MRIPQLTAPRPNRHYPAATALTTALLLVLQMPAQAALTDIAQVPLTSSSTTVVKPNILFTLDDSGSMAWGFMPDNVESRFNTTGYKNHLCNTVYYNPSITYVPPKNADGTNFANATFTNARYDGFDSTSSTRDLASNYIAFDNTTSSGNGSDTAQAAYYYVWNGSGTPDSGSTSNTTGCWPASNSSATHTTGNWSKRLVSATSGPGSSDERQNFANWYTYYRTRLLMMKSAAGRAFVGIGEGFRVGFITINPNNPVSSDKYLAISDFSVTQKSDWYTKLYAQGTNGSTPLREALSRAGRHFAGIQTGINSGMTGDPMQYSCQQNFTILTTDGFWNSNAGIQLNGSAIGNQDGDITTMPRPMYDGAIAVTSTVTTTVEQFYSNCSGGRRRIRATTTVSTTPISPPGPTSTSSNTNNVTSCQNTPPPLQDPNPVVTTTTVTSTSGGSSNSLADVAAYYYNTDLRTAGSIGALGIDVGTDNNVPSASTNPEDDIARHQHMTTFTMGLGLAGTLKFTPNYKDFGSTNTSDFPALRLGTLNWPAPAQNDPTALDDLWHAAVNGRGQFFSAANPDSVVASLSAALAGVNARTGSASAASTSTLQPVAGDNFAYTASFRTQEWTGDLQAREINLSTGAISATSLWSAQAKLDARTNNACDNRVIKLFRASATATDKLVDFKWNTQGCDGSGNPTGSATTALDTSEQAFFGATQVAGLSQFPAMTDGSSGTVNQRSLAKDANLVNFLRGQRGLEGFIPNDATALYRTRPHVLGDIVSAQPLFVRAPFANFEDTGYAAFKVANANRTPMVYSGANDGMLHAFFAGTSPTDPQGGEEAWALIPSALLPELHRLADNNYGTLHRFYVDGSPIANDVFDTTATSWKTILVGGFNGGGKGYYALDITDPANPKGLWEFKHDPVCSATPVGQTSDCHLGLSYGNPQISKLADGRWVVFVTSGYNNVNSPAATGDGQGYLYVLNAITGQIIYKISTGAGDATTPSGLAKINTFIIDSNKNNTTQHLYGTDLLGNVWRFEVNASQTATRLATLTDPSGNPQPITTKPQLAEFGSPPIKHVFVATGRILGSTDLPSTQVQTVWGLKDYGTTITTPRTALSQLTIVDADPFRSISCVNNCTSSSGWYANLPVAGERVNIEMNLQLGALIVGSNVPQETACTVGGFSFLNFFDARNGLQIAGSPNFGIKIPDTVLVGVSFVTLPSGKSIVISMGGTGNTLPPTQAHIPPGDPQGRRTSWRELSTDK